MEVRELKEVMKKVHIKSEMEEEIMKNVMDAENEREQGGKHMCRRRMTGWQGKIAVAAIAVMIVGVGGVAVHAVVGDLAKKRMESMPEETKETLLDDIDAAEVDADTYSREMTDRERERKKELTIAYNKGQFPEGELKKVEDSSQIDKDTLCYVPSSGYMHLPDRELTDEEILQIIEYYEKMDFVLQERYEEENEDVVKKQKKLKEKVEAEGGISEKEAIKKAEKYLDEVFGKTSDGIAVRSNIWTAEEGEEWGVEVPDGKPVYAVTYYIRGVENYYIYISSTDGALLGTDYSGED